MSTNIVYFRIVSDGMSPLQLAAALQDRQILMNPIDQFSMRAVLHCGVSDSDVEVVLEGIAEVMEAGPTGDTDKVSVYG